MTLFVLDILMYSLASALYNVIVDIDECGVAGKHNCSENEACINEPLGSFTCVCKSGYQRLNGTESCEGMTFVSWLLINLARVFTIPIPLLNH